MPTATTRSARATVSFIQMGPPAAAPSSTLVWLRPWASTTRSRAATAPPTRASFSAAVVVRCRPQPTTIVI